MTNTHNFHLNLILSVTTCFWDNPHRFSQLYRGHCMYLRDILSMSRRSLCSDHHHKLVNNFSNQLKDLYFLKMRFNLFFNELHFTEYNVYIVKF